MNEQFLADKLKKRKDQGIFRELKIFTGSLIDFSSNDYLGIVKYGLLREPLENLYASGSTGSRLLTGNYPLITDTEERIAHFHETESALILNSGYDANLALLSCVPQRGDLILYDELSHASIRDGVKLSQATAISFAHNDVEDLEAKLKRSVSLTFVVTESVFSMDGDLCPLKDIVDCSEKYGALLIVDEAHATGLVGVQGEGLTQELKLSENALKIKHNKERSFEFQ